MPCLKLLVGARDGRAQEDRRAQAQAQSVSNDGRCSVQGQGHVRGLGGCAADRDDVVVYILIIWCPSLRNCAASGPSLALLPAQNIQTAVRGTTGGERIQFAVITYPIIFWCTYPII